jgi:hypothetical protein
MVPPIMRLIGPEAHCILLTRERQSLLQLRVVSFWPPHHAEAASPEVGDAVGDKAPYNDNSRCLPMLLDVFMKCHFVAFEPVFASCHFPRVYPC